MNVNVERVKEILACIIALMIAERGKLHCFCG